MRMGGTCWSRVRWGNIGRTLVVAGVVGLVVAWPRLAGMRHACTWRTARLNGGQVTEVAMSPPRDRMGAFGSV